MTDRPARLKLYEVSAQALVLSLQTNNVTKVTDGIPDDGSLVDFGYHPERQVFYLTVEHESFNKIREGESIPTGTVTVEEISGTQWGGLTQYEIDKHEVTRVDAYRIDPDLETFHRVSLDEEDKIGLKSGSEIPNRFEFVGTAEDHEEPPMVWGVWATHDAEEWTAVGLDEQYDV